jgi:hypothetical protein
MNKILIAVVALIVSAAVLLGVSHSGTSFGATTERTTFTNLVTFAKAVTFSSAITGTSGTFSSSLTSGALTQGGGITATSTSGAVVPLLASDFDTENVIDVTLNVVAGTVSFPATTTLTSFIPTAGQTRTLYIRNATTTAATTLTVAGGTGVLAKFASTTPATTGVITGDTDGANFARVTLIRKANTDIEALISLFKD